MARVLVTGASRGLGLGFCSALSERGDDVLAACRGHTPSLSALPGVTVIEGVELSDVGSAQRIRSALGRAPLDLVICNAGINRSHGSGIGDVRVDVLAHEFQVNALGAVRTVQAAAASLRRGSKVALISSGVVNPHGRGRQTPAGYGYKMSKAALNEFGVALANELAPSGVAVFVLDPGPMNTDLLRDVFAAGHTMFDPSRDGQDPKTVAIALLRRIKAGSMAQTGRWLNAAGGELEI
jgi:NAD(P)-dependent dehydrogenase (short-subunit alcohol dehydrogenase family)